MKVLDAVDPGMPREEEEVARISWISPYPRSQALAAEEEAKAGERGRRGSESHAGGSSGQQKGGALCSGSGWRLTARKRPRSLTLAEHREALEGSSGVKVSAATMSRRICRLQGGGGWPLAGHSKRVPQSSLPPSATRRSEDSVVCGAVACGPLRDARGGGWCSSTRAGFHLSMTGPRARAPRGKGAYGEEIPRDRGKNFSILPEEGSRFRAPWSV